MEDVPVVSVVIQQNIGAPNHQSTVKDLAVAHSVQMNQDQVQLLPHLQFRLPVLAKHLFSVMAI